MKKSFFVLTISICFYYNLFAQRTEPNSGIFWAPMTINNITAWYSSDGRQEGTNTTLKISGATFPRKTARTVFMSGFLYGGNRTDTTSSQLFVNGAYYTNTLRQGAILGIQTGIVENRFGPEARIWRIRKDFSVADLRRDAAETYGIAENNVGILDMQRLRNEYKKDWIEWPASKGAPYYDKNNNGVYDPKFTTNDFNVEIPDTSSDSPGLADADQVIWYTCNDLGGNSPWATASVGIETQVTIWAYKSTNALGNTIFRRGRLIFKGKATTPSNQTLQNMYIGVWSSIDLGQATDNFAGSDSLLGLGFLYNSRVLDIEYVKYNIVPPAVGFDIVQGARVSGSANDSALFNFQFRKGSKNLPVTSVIYTSGLNPPISNGSTGAPLIYNSLQGLVARSNVMRIDPVTSRPTKFWSPGDPVSRIGWIDGTNENTGSRELYISTGPFTMALGDTQEIVTALIAAHSPDRVASVHVLKYYDKIVQDSYSKLLVPSKIPPTPNATATELDRSILLEWEKDAAQRALVESFSSGGYLFEGYNVYQLPSATAPQYEWTKIATYDLKNEVTQIVQDDINPITGRIEQRVVHDAKNSGLVRYLLLKKDSLANREMINGQEYHFAVTAYSYTTSTTLPYHSLESEPKIFTVTPHKPNPETVVSYTINDSLITLPENVIGNNDGRIGVKILDPYSVVGGSYDVWFGIVAGNNTWTFVKTLPGTDYTTITGKLTGNELAVPRPNPLPTTTGTATFTLNDALDKIAYSVDINSPNTITSIEVYYGPKNSNGSLIKTLGTNSKNISGVWTKNDAIQPLTDDLIKHLIGGYLYVLVRSTTYPNGEMRAQLSDGLTPRATLPLPDATTSSRSVFTFSENRLPNEGFSLYVAPSSIGFKSGEQIAPTKSNIVNAMNPEGTYYIMGPGYSWGAYQRTESTIEIRFTNDTNWAIVSASIPAQTKYIRVPFQVYQDSVRVWAVVANAIPTDSVWDTKGNFFQNGKPTFDKIVGVVSKEDFAGTDISYNATVINGELPTTNSMKGRFINAVNHIAQNIIFVNMKEDGKSPAAGTRILLSPYKSIEYGDIKRFTLKSVQTGNKSAAKQQLNTINVFPNPYYGAHGFETSTSNKYVTFSHLPEKATIRIFNLGGIHTRTLHKNDPEQFLRWDLRNEKGFFVASGIYIVYIEMEGIGTKILKLAVVMEDLNLNAF